MNPVAFCQRCLPFAVLFPTPHDDIFHLAGFAAQGTPLNARYKARERSRTVPPVLSPIARNPSSLALHSAVRQVGKAVPLEVFQCPSPDSA